MPQILSVGASDHHRKVARLLTAVALALLPGMAGGFQPLPRMNPGAAGVDPVRLGNAIQALQQIEGARSVVVVRGGAVVDESHWFAPADHLHPVWSVTKSVTSTLVGIAVDRGILPGVDVSMPDFLPPELIPADPRKQGITLRDLLTMTSGLQWSEEDDWLPWIASSDPARFILERPLVSQPGTEFNYSSAASHLPSLILTEASGVSSLDLADAFLFGPLGITERHWQQDPQGYFFGGHGLKLRTEDLAKLGVLFLNHGLWGGHRVLPSSWVREATRPRFGWGESWGPIENLDYGYLWWTAEAGGDDVFLAWGWGGQFAFCVPALDLVVATAADGEVWADQADRQEKAILNVIVHQILPAVSPDWRGPRRPAGRQAPTPPRIVLKGDCTSDRRTLSDGQ